MPISAWTAIAAYKLRLLHPCPIFVLYINAISVAILCSVIQKVPETIGMRHYKALGFIAKCFIF